MRKWICAILVLALCASVALAEGAQPGPVSGGDAAAAASESQESARPKPAAEAKEKSEAPQRSEENLSVAALNEAGEAHSEAGAEKHAEAASPADGASAAKSEAASGANEAKSEAAHGAEVAKNEAADGAQGDAGANEISATEAQKDAPGDAEASETAAPGNTQDAQGDAEAGETSAPGEQAGEPGDAPAESEAPSGAPGENTPSPEEGSGDPAAEPTEPGADLADPEADAAEPEAYILVDGEKKTGTLAELLASPGAKTVYLLAAKAEEIPDFPLVNLKDVTLLPDPDTYTPKENYAVKLMNGDVEITPEAIAAAVDERVKLLASVVELEQEEPVDPSKVKLTVTPLNYTPGVWMNTPPEFLLSGISGDQIKQGYSYLVILYGEELVSLDENFYLPQKEGVYTLSFAIMDPLFDMVSKSDVYEVKLDLTPPELDLAVSETKDYKMTFSATDEPGGAATEASGVAEYSLDGGTTWLPLGEGETITHTETQKKVFPPKTILVRDFAGNIAGNAEEVVLDRLPGLEGFGGGGDSSSTPSVPHASGDGDTSPYASYELALPQGEVSELTLGGEAIDLHLDVDGNGPANFAAELTSWTADSDANAADEEASAPAPAQDTLVVRAESNGSHSFVWRINGSVLRKLYNSDIRYLALCADDAMLSLPTVGFTAGTKYAELKMGGVSTAEFVYEISMRTGSEPPAEAWNRSADCAVEIAVSVSGERYVMLDRGATPEMYSYDVYCGPDDLPDYPYGAYPGMEG